MKITAGIKQNRFIKKSIDIEKFIKEEKLLFGSYNVDNVLRENKLSREIILFDYHLIGRGICLLLIKKNIFLSLELPAGKEEIKLFYQLVGKLMKELEMDYFYQDDKKYIVNDFSRLIEEGSHTSEKLLYDMSQKIYLTGDNYINLICARHPIAIGETEIDKIDYSLEKFEKLLDNLQSKRAYYTCPTIFQRRNGTHFGIYPVDEDLETIIPITPDLYNNKLEISNWYILFSRTNTILLDTFHDHVSKKYYDANHYIVNLNSEEINELVEKYMIDTNTNLPSKGYYFGSVIDNAVLYQLRLSTKKNIDRLACYSHIAIYIRYAYEHKLLSDRFLEAIPTLKTVIEEKKEDLRKLIRDNHFILGEVKTGFFNETGKKFTIQYYRLESEGYLNDLKVYAKLRLDSVNDGLSFLAIPYDEKYYQDMSKYIDNAFNRRNI